MLTQLIVTSAASGAREPRAARKIALAKPPQFHIKNKVNLIGFLGGDAEVRSANNRSFTTLSLATKSSYKDKKSGEYVAHADATCQEEGHQFRECRDRADALTRPVVLKQRISRSRRHNRDIVGVHLWPRTDQRI
jgi:hypothetical protein